MTVPTINSSISKAVSVAGRLIDVWLSYEYSNGLLSKVLHPVAQCISDIGKNKEKPVDLIKV